MKTEIVFWQKNASIHQSAMLSEISKLHEMRNPMGKVVLNIVKSVSHHRQKMGWEDPKFSKITVNVGIKPTRSIFSYPRNSIFVFSGFAEHWYNALQLFLAVIFQRKCIVILEAPRNDDWLSPFRNLKYRVISLLYARSRVLLLPIGKSGTKYYSQIGFKEQRIVEFGYFPNVMTAAVNFETQTRPPCSRPVKLVFVGSLTIRKGIIPFMRTLLACQSRNWLFTIVGDGPIRQDLVQLVKRNSAENSVNFLGVLPNKELPKILGECDLLVLPSKYDGWGAVVNEALFCGVPVLVSDRAGSSCIVQDQSIGSIFPTEPENDRINILERFLDRGVLDKKSRKKIQKWALKTVSPEAGAAYFLQIIESTDWEFASCNLKPQWEPDG
jgi:glycosyltransferase involved in cell wall biosynthesis